jgi:hypothetical protein
LRSTGREGFGGSNFTFLDTPSLLSSAKWRSRVAMPMWCIAQPLDRRWLQWVNRAIFPVSWWRLLDPNDRTDLTGIGDSESGQIRTLAAQQYARSFDHLVGNLLGRMILWLISTGIVRSKGRALHSSLPAFGAMGQRAAKRNQPNVRLCMIWFTLVYRSTSVENCLF